MKKKFICTVCGYIYEGTEAPEKCPICKAPASKFKEMEDAVDDDMTFATVHVLGQAYKDGVNEEVIKGLKDHFNGECGEVGMYLAMARQADREGYPEIAEAYKQHAEEVDNLIKNHAKGWDFDRLVKVDKDILRIAISELLYVEQVPHKVVVDEAVELAKKYSTEDSSAFVNGLLAKVIFENGIK